MDDLILRVLLVRMLGGGAAGGADLGAFVQQQVAADPRFAQIAALMGVTHGMTPAAEVIDQAAGPDDVPSELDVLRARTAALAAALGACVECWGEDPACPECQGRGGPGSRMPHHELFRRLVAPAVLMEAGALDGGGRRELDATTHGGQ